MDTIDSALPDRHMPEFVPTLVEVRDAFVDAVGAAGGRVVHLSPDLHRVFARAVLPRTAPVRGGDQIQAGVALRVDGAAVLVHPYTFRQVCANGAIAAHVLGTESVERLVRGAVPPSAYDAGAILDEVRAAVQGCAAPGVFDQVVDEMRAAAAVPADLALHLLPALQRLPAGVLARVLPAVAARFAAGGDPTAFGLLNAVTSIGRDERDPALCWTLEAIGGTVPARLDGARVPERGAEASAYSHAREAALPGTQLGAQLGARPGA